MTKCTVHMHHIQVTENVRLLLAHGFTVHPCLIQITIPTSYNQVTEHCIATFAQSAGSCREDPLESLASTTGSIECTEPSFQPELQSSHSSPAHCLIVWCLSAVHSLLPACVFSIPQTIKADMSSSIGVWTAHSLQ